MELKSLHPIYETEIARIERLAATENLWQETAKKTIARIVSNSDDADHILQTLHEIQRLSKIAVTGLENDQAFFDAVQIENAPMWKDFTAPPAALTLHHSLADKLYNIHDDKDIGYLNLGDGSKEIGKYLFDKTIQSGAKFIANFADAGFDALVLNHSTDDMINTLTADFMHRTKSIKRIMTARSGLPVKEPAKADKDKADLYQTGISGFGERVGSGDIFYTLTAIPTKRDAQTDGIDYDEYIKLFFEMCDQPWDDISKAQQHLIAEFNKASDVRITNNDGTDVTMSLIDKDGSHFTFCNSVIAKNVPGSEIFSAPRIDSLNGKVVAKGKFNTQRGKIIENLTMEFKNGHLMAYSADKGLDAFEEEIGIDAGAKMVGELGVGTNPHLKQHVANGLLVEKIGGSFHLALGRAYSYTNYQGDEVKVDNGNRSSLHWDITTMLFGKEGRIYLDGKMIMDDGFWLDKSKYNVLNHGWAAIDNDKRPPYWQKRLDNKPKV